MTGWAKGIELEDLTGIISNTLAGTSPWTYKERM